MTVLEAYSANICLSFVICLLHCVSVCVDYNVTCPMYCVIVCVDIDLRLRRTSKGIICECITIFKWILLQASIFIVGTISNYAIMYVLLEPICKWPLGQH